MTLPERPLARLPRWAAALLLVLTAFACAWNGFALDARNTAHEADIVQRTERGERLDMDLYRAINRRVAGGEDYYAAAVETHREFGFETAPFVTVRTPVLAWTSALWGEQGWRLIAMVLWGANILAWFVALGGKAGLAERVGAGLLAAIFGMIAFMDDIPFSHEALGGLMLSLALALSRTKAWAGGLAIAAFAIALRELALPFLLAWGAVAALVRDQRKAVAIGAAIGAIALGLFVHAQAVGAARDAGDLVSTGWSGLFGPSLPLYGIHVTTLLQLLPWWLAGALGVLPLLGWLSFGGRTGAIATLWFGGFIAAVAIFARQENFYWMGLFVPAYGVGLAFVPRALRGLVEALKPSVAASPTP